MPSSSKRSSESKQSSNNRQRNRAQQSLGLENLQARATSSVQNNELGRTDKYAERTNKIHPVKLSRSPSATYRYPVAKSPPNQPYNVTKSPLISALGTTANGATQYTSDWAKSIPYLNNARQTGQTAPTNVSGSSPPSQSRPRDASSHAHLSPSPPANVGGRPLSHPNSISSFGGRYQQSPPSNMYAASRRASMYSQYGQRPLSGHIPLPHEDQPHFYGAPQLDFGIAGGAPGADKIKPGDRGYFCGFDALDGAGDAASVGVENVIITGYEGGLEISSVEHDGAQLIGVLDGLPGGVFGAKLLPWNDRTDPCASLRPLVAIVLHGPVISDQNTPKGEKPSDGGSENALTDSPPMNPNLSRSEEALSRITNYQTTVEVWSLQSNKRISTLYISPPVSVTQPYDGSDFEPPRPVGDITLDACGKFIAVALGGNNGELYMFTLSPDATDETSERFRCIGKLWTSVQPRQQPAPSTSNSTGAFPPDLDVGTPHSAPLFSLNDRWLAIVPPPSGSQFSFYGTPLNKSLGNQIPGMTSSVAPSMPAINCAVDTPDDRFINRVSREMAKNFVRGAQWVGDQGKQWWKHYTSKDPSPPAAQNGFYPGPPAYPTEQQSNFPPTHALGSASQSTSEPPIVAIYDLNRLLLAVDKKSKNALNPIAAFEQPLGCSFLSFAPSGLHLLTVNKKGDTQILWDLKRMCHGRGAPTAARGSSIYGPHVREATRFIRVTDTNVVDVIWSAPKDDKVAILTEVGTLHVHHIPQDALQWPPPRRIARSTQPHQSHSAHPSTAASPEPPSPSHRSRLNSAVDAVNGAATSWLSSIRSRSLSNGHNIPSLNSLSLTPAVGAKSAKAVAASAGRTIGKGVHYIQHAKDNKIYLNAANGGTPRSAVWMTGKSRGLIATVADGNVKTFRTRIVVDPARGGKDARRTVVKILNQIPLNGLPCPRIAPAVTDQLVPPSSKDHNSGNSQIEGQGGQGDLPNNDSGKETQGMWQPRSPTMPGFRQDRNQQDKTEWRAYAEVHSTCDYAKFHTDPRVSLFVYADPGTSSSAIFSGHHGDEEHHDHQQQEHNLHHVDDSSPWVFGLDIPTRKISSGAAAAVKAGIIAGEDGAADLVWSSRERGADGEDAEGFFEDDVDVIDFAEDRV
ncbi:hypothetical protein NA57DRAFT_81185 [Rhizodiscina lignyota]|uniref:WD40 repeat-like protein n=1 Tax=Rhizodiscina lignyota TaxID=1504668 RepID=A0A9P4I5S0_9PEZI|nr:hypothetical protein NA57DRAFT_81185 [Rhizodiscina lignyota]